MLRILIDVRRRAEEQLGEHRAKMLWVGPVADMEQRASLVLEAETWWFWKRGRVRRERLRRAFEIKNERLAQSRSVQRADNAVVKTLWNSDL